MPDREYEILCYIRKNHVPLWSDILNAYDPQNRINEIHTVLLGLLSAGLIELTCPLDRPPRCRVRLTGSGVVALLEETSVRAENVRSEQSQKDDRLHQIAADKANRKAKRRADRIFQISLALLNALLSFLVEILLNRNAELIVNIVKHFFEH